MDERKPGSFLEDQKLRCDGTEISFAVRNTEDPSKDAEAVSLLIKKEILPDEIVKLAEDGTKFITDAMLHFEQQRRIQQRRRHFWN